MLFRSCNDVAETKLIAFAKWQVRPSSSPSLSSTDQLRSQVPTLTANVVALTAGSKAPLKVHKPAGLLTIVTVGPSGGAGQLFGFVIGVRSSLPPRGCSRSLTRLCAGMALVADQEQQDVPAAIRRRVQDHQGVSGERAASGV